MAHFSNLFQGISIVVPVLNERENLRPLIRRIDRVLGAVMPYEVIVVDDHSDDGSVQEIENLSRYFPVSVFRKQGEAGKAQSLREGFAYCQYNVLAFIDADLQYPPEALLEMYQRLYVDDADVVVTERLQWKENSLSRRLLSAIYRHIFTRFLFQLPYDTQSGLKMFRRSLLPIAEMPTPAWHFDIPFLWHALRLGKRIISHPITFSGRVSGVTKVRTFSTGWGLLTGAVRLRWGSQAMFPLVKADLPRYWRVSGNVLGTDIWRYLHLRIKEYLIWGFSLQTAVLQIIVLRIPSFQFFLKICK
jgi:dolichol-phosphate mannosyltransferase